MYKNILSILLLALGLSSYFVQVFGVTDSLMIYDPYLLTKTDFLINYDTSINEKKLTGNIGLPGNISELPLIPPDTITNSFTSNILVSDHFDMGSYPVRANIALMKNGYTTDRRIIGSGILISPNAVLTAGHLIGFEATSIEHGKYFKWKDSLVVVPSYDNGHPQNEFGIAKVNGCYIFKRFYNSMGHQQIDDLALLILDQPIGYKTGWFGLSYVSSVEFLQNNIFYNFSYPGEDGYDGMNMFYKYGYFTSVTYDFTIANNSIVAVGGESGSGFFYSDNNEYTAYGIRTYAHTYTLISQSKFYICSKLISENLTQVNSNIINESLELIIYPNPATNFFTVLNLVNPGEFYNIQIYDLKGSLIYINERYMYGNRINTADFSPGVYFIKLTVNQNILTGKLQILRR